MTKRLRAASETLVPLGEAQHVTCQCGKSFTLYWNGGELDGETCDCGREYHLEHRMVVLVTLEPVDAV